MLAPGGSRSKIARTLGAAYSGGLLSPDTFVARLDELLESRIINPSTLVDDLSFRKPRGSRLSRFRAWLTAPAELRPASLLGLDWSGEQPALLIGRHEGCDIVLREPSVSREHARLVFRDHRWIIQDLRSTNGTIVNGARVGRSEIRPGDLLALGDERLRVD
jgi:hypothetical protein